MAKIKVLHFTKVINRNDFIDVIVRNADRSQFSMMASSYRGLSNIEDPNYGVEGIPFFALDIDHGWTDMFKGAWRLAHILSKEKIDILHTHHFYEAIIGRLACLFYPKTKHVIGRHYHDQLYLTTSGVKLKFYLFVEHVVNVLASAIIVPSSKIVDLLRKQKVSECKIKFIPYCFDFNVPRYTPLSDKKIESKRKESGWENKFVIGNIGRHHVIKGQTYLLQAFKEISKEIPNSILVMLGDGPHHQALQEEVEQLKLSGLVHFLGWSKNAHALINCIDVVVHPTLQEAFPQLMVEVMALRRPLVITPVSGVSDVIVDRVNGYLIPFHDYKGIVDAVKNVYTQPETAKRISSNGSEYVRSHFTIQKIIPHFEQVYKDLIFKE